MIAHFLAKNPRILFLIVVVVVVSGVASLIVMPRLEDPVLGKRVAVISTVLPGANPQRVESVVTIRLENLLRGIPEIKELRSSSRAGISNIVLQLNDHVDDVEATWSEVRKRLADSPAELPENCLPPEFEVFALKAFAAIVSIQGRSASSQEMTKLRRLAAELSARLENLPGTEATETFGDPGEEFAVEVEPRTLASLSTSVGALAQQIAAGNASQPGGALRGSDATLIVEFESADEPIKGLRDTMVRAGPRGSPRRLDEIAQVRRAEIAPASEAALIRGKPAVVLGAHVDDRSRVDLWTNACRDAVAEFQREYDGEVDVQFVFLQERYVSQRLESLLMNLLIGGYSVTVVVFLLMGWKSTLVVGATLLLSCLLVLTGMRLLYIPLHQMSITGLVVALGLLIDNAIVVVEDIRHRVRRGDVMDQAIQRSIRHLRMPLFASTLTTALAFLPIAMLPGPAGEFVGTIAVSVILAISASYCLAMTVVPALTALLKFDAAHRGLGSSGFSSRLLAAAYAGTLRIAFRFPWLGVLAGIVLPIVGYFVAFRLPEQFFPPSDRNQVHVELELPAGEPIERTLEAVASVQQDLENYPQVQSANWFIGRSAPTFFYNVVPRRRGTPFYAQAIVEVSENASVESFVRSMQSDLDDRHADLRVLVRQLDQGPPLDAPIELRVLGPDLATLQELGSELRLLLNQTPGVIHTRSDSEETIPTLEVEVDAQKASQAGLEKAAIAGILYTSLEGAPAGRIFDGVEELPVRIKLAELKENRLSRLAALPLPVRAPAGAARPDGNADAQWSPPFLGSLAQLSLGSDVATITRINGRRANEIKAYVQAGLLASPVLADFRQRIDESEFGLPPGYDLVFEGERAERTRAIENLMANAVVLGAVMVLAVVASFGSFRSATIIILVGALAAGVGPLALWWVDFPFGFMAILGTMGLVGVAINDSIVVLAAIRENRAAAPEKQLSVVQVVMGCTRHIVATTLTTIAGFTPLILAGGGFWPPLAITIAGGVGGATLLALYLVPSLQLILHGREQ